MHMLKRYDLKKMHLIKHRPTASGNEIPLLPWVRHENRFTSNGKKVSGLYRGSKNSNQERQQKLTMPFIDRFNLNY